MMTCGNVDFDVVIIGAGPSGAVAAAILLQKGYNVCVVERQVFPRFSIGESLLPQAMVFLEEAGLAETVKAQDFQFKEGANFHWAGAHTGFDFSNKSSNGPATTFQVIRADFDKLLIDEVAKRGADVRFGTTVTKADFDDDGVTLSVNDGETDYRITAKFCLDASGFGRVLPRFLGLDKPSSMPPRRSFFTHVTDRINHPDFNRDRILINVHPEYKDVWYWVIPFSNGTSSVGVVGEVHYFDQMMAEGTSHDDILKTFISHDPFLQEVFKNAEFKTEVRSLVGYSCAVSSLYGRNYALLGNAGEFLDPVFSSGITIAMKSSSLAAAAVDRQLRGENVDWQADFADPLMIGVESFRAFVESWYEGRLIDIFFTERQDADIRRHLTSILAGYAWDKNNPYVTHSKRRLSALHEVCAA